MDPISLSNALLGAILTVITAGMAGNFALLLRLTERVNSVEKVLSAVVQKLGGLP